ncbi:DUF4375 domain-containing protein [Xanthobacteraceae bacterium A53D]
MTDAETCRADWLRETIDFGSRKFDPAVLTRVALRAVLAGPAEDFIAAASGPARKVENALAAYPVEARHLLSLSVLLRGWYAHYGPEVLFRHIFSGAWGNAAPEMADALAAAGATKQEQALRAAIASFPAPFRRDTRRGDAFGDYWAPPNALVQAMIDNGIAFGTRAELVEIVADFAAGSPERVAWCNAQRQGLKDADRLGWLVDTLIQKVGQGRPASARKQVQALPEAYRNLYLTAYAEFEIANGGIHQYFTNSSGTFAPLAVDAFQAIGLPDHAQVIASGVALFPAPFPDDPGKFQDKQARAAEKETGEPWTDWDERLAGLTKGWAERKVRPAIRAYVKAQGILPV